MKLIHHHGMLLMGAAILSFGLYNVHSQSEITEGGVLGLTLLLQHWFHLSPGVTGICIDSLCYLLAFRLLGTGFLKNALVTSIYFSVCYNIQEAFGYVLPNLKSYPILASALGGIFVGIGVGMIIREGGASGGDDALALMISKGMKCRISKAYLLTDFVVLFLSISYIPMTKIAFSIVTVCISSFLIERIQNIGRVLEEEKEDEIEFV